MRERGVEMSDGVIVSIEGLNLRGHCGVTPEERAVGQNLIVNVTLAPRKTRATRTDALEDTVDYGRVVDLARAVVEGTEHRLLERLATDIVERIWAEFSLVRLAVTVRKPAPPVAVPVDAACVEVVRTA
jgi:dihydroneopterin aldolase